MSSEELEFEESEFEGLNSDEQEELKESLLNLFDFDNSGNISQKSVQKTLESTNLSKTYPSFYKKVYDIVNSNQESSDGNLEMDINTFLDQLLINVSDSESNYGITKLFKLWDEKNNGYLEKDVFVKTAKNLVDEGWIEKEVYEQIEEVVETLPEILDFEDFNKLIFTS